MARLIVLAGQNMGEAYELGQTNAIGSGEGNAVQIIEPDISEYHAQLSRIKRRYYIVNLTVDDVIEVNGREIEKLMLSNGDSIKIGECVLLFSDEEEDENDATEDVLSESSDEKDIDFGKYRIIEEISRGAHAVVYKAIQKGLDRVVALKVLLAGEHSSRDDINRFYREARAVGKLTHPHIVPIFDIGYIKQTHYFAMEYIEGDTLENLLGREAISPTQGLRIIRDVASALEYAHSLNIIHRDIKPSNILVDKFGKVMLSDFGIAKQLGVEQSKTQTGQSIGTPSYMSPEQAEGKSRIDTKTDIYALGGVLYEIFTGHKPYDGETAASILMKVLTEEPLSPYKLNPKLNPDIATIIMKAMERDPERRYSKVTDMASDINNFMRGYAITAKPASRYYRIKRTLRKNSVVVFAIAAVITITIVATFAISTANKKSRKAISEATTKARREAQAEIDTAKEEVLALEKARWEQKFDSNNDEFTDWKLIGNYQLTPKKANVEKQDHGFLDIGKGQGAKFVAQYTGKLSGNLKISFKFTAPPDGKIGTISGYIGQHENNGLRFIFGKWQQHELVLMRAGKVLAAKTIPEPKPGTTYTIDFHLGNISSWIQVQTDNEPTQTLNFQGLEQIKVIASSRQVGLRFEHCVGRLHQVGIQEEQPPVRPNRLIIAHKDFFNGRLREAFDEYMAVANSPAYQDNIISLESLYWAGLVLQEQNRHEKAILLYKKALDGSQRSVKATQRLKLDCFIQLFICHTTEGQLTEAIDALKRYQDQTKEKNIKTDWEWHIISLLPRFVHTKAYHEAIDVVKRINWTQNNKLLLKPLKHLAGSIATDNPSLLEPLAAAYPNNYLNTAINIALSSKRKKKAYEGLNSIIEPLLSHITPNARTHITLTALYAEHPHDAMPPAALLHYFYKYSNLKPSPIRTGKGQLGHWLKSKDFSKMAIYYSYYPADDFFTTMIEAERKLQSPELGDQTFSLIHPASPLSDHPILGLNILLETKQYQRIVNQSTLDNRPLHGETGELAIRRALAQQMVSGDESIKQWDILAGELNSSSLPGVIAQLMSGSISPDDARNMWPAKKDSYKLSFFIGLYYFLQNDIDLARIHLQESLAGNKHHLWPYQNTKDVSKAIYIQN